MRRRVRAEQARANDFEAEQRTVHTKLTVPVHQFLEHYHHERNHQGRDNQLLQRPPPPVNPDADVERRERLGGLLSCYYREAA